MYQISSRREILLLKKEKRRIRIQLCTKHPRQGIITGTVTSLEERRGPEEAGLLLKEKDGNQKARGCFSLPGVQAFKGLLLLLLYLLDAHFICVYIVTFNTMVI